MSKWFKNVSNIEDLKKEYRKLSKQYHPDMSKDVDTTKIFIEINTEYDKLFKVLKSKAQTKSNNSSEKSNDDEKHVYDSDFKTIIDILVQYDDLNVEIVGTWIWISGNTYNNRQIIKELSFKWSNSNKKWYWHEGDMTKRVRKAQSWDYKVSKYGCESLKTTGRAKLS